MTNKNHSFAVFFLLLAAVNLILSLTIARESPITVQAKVFFTMAKVQHPGDLIPLYQVLQSCKTGRELIYREHFFGRNLKFIYPPTAMAFFHPFRKLPEEKFQLVFADIVNRLFLLLGIACSAFLFHRLGRLSAYPRRQRLILYGSFALLLLTFYPFFKAFTLGQAQVWINSLILLALVAMLLQRPGAAGVAMALCTLIKPSYGLILLWGLVRKNWRFSLVFILVCLIGLGVSLSLYGWQNHLDYLKVFRLIGERGEGYYPNQSLNGLLNRLLGTGSNLTWNPRQYPLPHPVVFWGTTLFSLLLTLFGVILALRKRKSSAWPTFTVMLLCISLASPIAWEHSYGYTFPLFIFAILLALQGKTDWRRLAPATAAFLLASHFLHFINLRFHTGPWTLFQSYLFFAELTLLGIMAFRSIQQPEVDDLPSGNA